MFVRRIFIEIDEQLFPARLWKDDEEKYGNLSLNEVRAAMAAYRLRVKPVKASRVRSEKKHMVANDADIKAAQMATRLATGSGKARRKLIKNAPIDAIRKRTVESHRETHRAKIDALFDRQGGQKSPPTKKPRQHPPEPPRKLSLREMVAAEQPTSVIP